jgi:sterol desaturase/sphingolipid hydroxylase (fatty acid hydroxylase superfamily)
MDWVQFHSIGLIAGTLGAFIVVALAEILWPERESRVSTGLRWRVSGSFYLLNMGITFLIPITGFGAALYAAEHGLGLIPLLQLDGLPAILLTVALIDLGQYVYHRALHRVPLLWRVHKVHHSDNDYDLTTGVRFHPLETVLTIGFRISINLLLGSPIEAVVIWEIWSTLSGFYGHGNVHLPHKVELVIRWVFVTPTMHCIHHSTVFEECDSNFSGIFSAWDRLLGTYTPAPVRGYKDMEFGVIGLEHPNGLSRLASLPFEAGD